MKATYTEILANAFKEVRAWKLTAVLLAGISVFLVIALIYQAGSRPVILVPANIAEVHGPVKVAPGGAFSGTSPDYLAQTALGDLALILDWQPDDVELQYQRFLNRCTNSLYARENVRLINEARKHMNADESQSFYPETTVVNLKTDQVIVHGVLVRWIGDKQVVRVRQGFTVTYRMQNGFLHVANVQTK